MGAYLDCNATAPIDPEVGKLVTHYVHEEFGNAGSRTHDYGARAKRAVQKAREQVSSVVRAKPDEVVFTSGATESNNLAILGLLRHGQTKKRRHVIATQVEHKAVLEPLVELEKGGFAITLVSPTRGGWVDPEAIRKALRPDTLLVSVMHANNETGVLQPITEIAQVLRDHETFLHVDAAQGFGKDIKPLQNPRVNLISVSGHKIYGPKGVGALITRRRQFTRPPLSPLTFGGGQERGLRPGTLPVPLIAGLGLASELALRYSAQRAEKCSAYKEEVASALESLNPHLNGDPERTQPHVLNLSFPGLDSEAVMVTLKDLVAISNGSACTSQRYEPSHVLRAMGLSDSQIQGAVRLSWCHMTEGPDWSEVAKRVQTLL